MISDPTHEDQVEQLQRRIAELQNRLANQPESKRNDDDYRYSVELSPQIFWIANSVGQIEDVNQRWRDFTGLAREQALGDGWTRVMHPADLPAMFEAWNRSIQTGEPYDVEHRICVREGGYRWVRARAFPRHTADGQIGRWYGTSEDIQDRKEAELLLKNSEQMFSAAFAEAPIGLVLLSVDGMILEVNQAYREMLGYSSEDLAGKNSADITHPADVDLTKSFFYQLQSGENKASIEKRYFHRDGHTIWTKASGTMRRDAQGRPMQVIAMVEDISNRKFAEAERERLLREVEAERRRLESVAAQMPSGLMIADADGKLLFFNAEVERILGRSLLIGSGYLNFSHSGALHPDGAALPAAEYPMTLSLLRGDVIRDEEVLYKRDDGTLATLQISSAPIYSESGNTEARKITGAVSVIGDITPRKQLEKILRDNEERLQLIFAQAPVGICVLRGRDLIYELVNPQYQALLPGRVLLGLPLLEAVPEVSPSVLEILKGVLETGVPFAATEFLIPLDQNGDGTAEDCWFNFVYHPLRDQVGQLSGVVAIAVDVSSHVRARAELQRANRELEEFAYVSSHDLQEPLRMINIYAQLLTRALKPCLTEETAVFADHIHNGVLRMEQLLRDLLDFSRTITSEPAGEQPVAVADLNASLNQAIETLRGRFEETQARLTVNPLPLVHADQNQLVQVFQNLLSNALKYRKAGEPPSIQISSRLSAEECVVVVADNGIGFPQNQAERIFGLFKRLHKNEYPGTGLGLAICQRIVERYAGRIWAESKPGEGSRFFFALRLPK